MRTAGSCALLVVLLRFIHVLYFGQDLVIIRAIRFRVNGQGPAEIFTHVEQHLYIEVEALVHALRGTAETCLARKGVDYLVLAEHDDSARRLLGFLDRERAALEAEVRAEAVVHHGEYLLAVPPLLDHRHRRIVVAPVHEYVLLPGVPVEIAVQIDLAAFERLLYHLLYRVAFREEFRTRVEVLPVQVVTRQATPIVADDDAIRVEHRHYLEYVAISQLHGHRFVADQVSYDTFHDKGAIALSGVHAPC